MNRRDFLRRGYLPALALLPVTVMMTGTDVVYDGCTFKDTVVVPPSSRAIITNSIFKSGNYGVVLQSA